MENSDQIVNVLFTTTPQEKAANGMRIQYNRHDFHVLNKLAERDVIHRLFTDSSRKLFHYDFTLLSIGLKTDHFTLILSH